MISRISLSEAKNQRIRKRLRALVGPREPLIAQDSPEAGMPDPQVADGAQLYLDTPISLVRKFGLFGFFIFAVTMLFIWLNRPVAVPAQAVSMQLQPSSSNSANRSPSLSAGPEQIVVDVEGAVRRPGLIELTPPARVADAIAAAGGLTRRLPPGSINLAATLSDGQLIVVSSKGNAASGTSDTSSCVSLSTATAAELEALPGIGTVMSERIISWRTEHGGFGSVDELQNVAGIGPKVFEQLKSLVCI